MIGREQELAAILDSLEQPGVLSLVGPGGVGKTTLALAAAARIEQSAQANVAGLRRAVVVDLAPVADAGLVPATVAAAVGARESEGADLLGVVAANLADEPSLLVLDNLEHLLGCAPFLGQLAAEAGPSRMLVTSRAATGLPSEHVLVIEPLAVPRSVGDVRSSPAGALFLRRSGTGAAELDPLDAAAITRVCAALDGLPLAIELAAAWSSLLSPRAIERRLLAGRLPLADGTARRHASVEGVIESSLELLGDEERLAFDALAVFAGRFDDESASAVLGPAALPVLRALASLSLVQVAASADGEPRFRLLETIRAVATRRLEADPHRARSARMAHAVEFERRSAAAAELLRHRSFGDPQAAEALEDPNVLTAFEFAITSGDVELAVALATWPASAAVRNGLISPAIDRIERAMALGPVGDRMRADALNALVSMRANRGESGVDGQARQAVEAARRSGDPRRIARTLVTLGNAIDDPAAAIPHYEEAANVAAAADYAWLVVNANLNLTWRLTQLGRHAEVIAAAERAIGADGPDAGPVGIGLALGALADAHMAMGDADRALAAYEASVERLRGVAPPQFITGQLVGLAILARRRHDRDAAIALLTEVVELAAPSEQSDLANDLALAAAVVLDESHPIEAAHGLAFVDRSKTNPAALPDLDRAAATIERRLGPAATRRALAAGRRAGVGALLAATQRLLAVEGPGARRQLRATYEAFTPREEQVLRLLAAGRSDPDIGEELGMSPKTASVHVANIKAKLALDSRVEAALEARRLLEAVGVLEAIEREAIP